MDGFKPPALTSPWKVGFLVSLLLVAMAIGVGFFITRAFGLTWTWIEFTGGSWDAWTFRTERFMEELAPLVILVPVLSMLSYFLVTGAVRRYRAYLNSGLDYYNLIESISSIRDLDDERNMKKLGDHKELRDFLLKTRDEVVEREQMIEEKEEMLAARAESLDTGDSMAVETGVLVSAIMNGPDGFSRDLTLTHPRLKEIDEAIRGNLLAGDEHAKPVAAPASSEAADALRAGLREAAEEFEGSVEDIRREAVALVDDASRLVSLGASPGEANASSALAGLDSVANSLADLGEETRALAIQMAMKASSSGDAAVVEMAESLRGVAERFGGVAARWEAEAVAAREEASSAQAPPTDGNELAERAQTLARTVEALSQGFDRFRGRLESETDATGSPEIDRSEVADPATGTDESSPGGVDLEGFERQSMEPVLNGVADDTGISDVQQDRDPVKAIQSPETHESSETNLFADIPGAPGQKDAAPPSGDATESNAPDRTEVVDSLFEEIAPAVAENTPETGPVASPDPVSESRPVPEAKPVASPDPVPESRPAPEAEPAASPDPVPESRPAPEAELAASPEPVPEAELSSPPDPAAGREDADVTDLYAIGAVDYEPENALHQV